MSSHARSLCLGDVVDSTIKMFDCVYWCNRAKRRDMLLRWVVGKELPRGKVLR